jgi:hypothetical protein
MNSMDFFRFTYGTTGACVDAYPGCYYFGGQPHAGFYLKLYSPMPCGVIDDGIVKFCAPAWAESSRAPAATRRSRPARTTGCDNFRRSGRRRGPVGIRRRGQRTRATR